MVLTELWSEELWTKTWYWFDMEKWEEHRMDYCSLYGSNCIWKGLSCSRTVPWLDKCSIAFLICLWKFATMLKITANARGKLFLQDDTSRQNSMKVRSSWDEVALKKFSIPARIPNPMKPTKFILHLVKQMLPQDTNKLQNKCFL